MLSFCSGVVGFIVRMGQTWYTGTVAAMIPVIMVVILALGLRCLLLLLLTLTRNIFR